jgi:hypothetical protein
MKTCKKEGCYRPVWGKGFCLSHQYLRQDKPKRPIYKTKDIQPTHKLDFGFDNQQDLFAWLWQEAKDKNGIVTCPYTGERLNRFYNTELYWSCFAHILAKGKYTYWKLNPKNVVVCFPDFHVVCDQGSSLDRANHPNWDFRAWDNRKEELKIEYELFKKQNLLA